MATVYFNVNINIDWTASNGATRRTLKRVVDSSFLPHEDSKNPVECTLGTLDKGNHSFIFVNKPKPNDKRILGVFMDNSYGYTVKAGKELFVNNSVGGYGNSESKFGIYEIGAVLEIHTYKNRNTPDYVKLTPEGWETIMVEELF